MKKLLKNSKGVAMPLALIVIFVVAILATALYFYSTNDFLQFTINRDFKSAQYLARTGVEATIKAWQAVTTDTLVPRDTFPVYMMPNGTFVTPEGGNAPDGNIGYYTVHVDPNGSKTIDGNEVRVIYFTSTAVVGETKAQATAYTVMSLDAYEQGWYTSNGVPVETGMTTIDSSVVNSSFWWGPSSSTVKGHVFPGNITFPQPSIATPKTFTLGANQKLAYAGKALYFDIPIKLGNGSNNKNVLILSGGDIVIDGDIELYAYYGLLREGVGTLVLSVLEDYEHDDPNTPESNRCGKVYFNGDVYVTVSTLLSNTRTKIFSRGEVYYFRGRQGETTQGLDLLKYYIDTNGTGSFISEIIASLYPSSNPYQKSDMRKIDPDKNVKDEPSDLIPPHPNEDGTVIWQ